MCRRLTLALTVVMATVVFSSLFVPSRAHAYSWMIRHGYTNCATCHVDPSGGSLLTPYGRAQGVLLMTSRYGATDDEAAVKQGELLFGAFDVPAALQLGGDVRGALLATSIGGGPVEGRGILMQADLQAGVRLDRFRAAGSLGFAAAGAFAASVVGNDEARMVSRTHWLGVALGADDEFLLRAGRINVPYGVRTIEHTAWIRKDTRSDINVSQQHGVALSYNGTAWRGEVMAILGNYQISPDAYRERGYSAYIELTPSEHIAFGVSSLVTHANTDLQLQTALWRQAHGAFVRYSPVQWLVLLAEADFLMYSQPEHNAFGVSVWTQADFEPTQGLHLIATVEGSDRDAGTQGLSMGGWAGVAWFFLPHVDVRIDGVLQSVAIPGAPGSSALRVTAESVIAQLHVYL